MYKGKIVHPSDLVCMVFPVVRWFESNGLAVSYFPRSSRNTHMSHKHMTVSIHCVSRKFSVGNCSDLLPSQGEPSIGGGTGAWRCVDGSTRHGSPSALGQPSLHPHQAASFPSRADCSVTAKRCDFPHVPGTNMPHDSIWAALSVLCLVLQQYHRLRSSDCLPGCHHRGLPGIGRGRDLLRRIPLAND